MRAEAHFMIFENGKIMTMKILKNGENWQKRAAVKRSINKQMQEQENLVNNSSDDEEDPVVSESSQYDGTNNKKIKFSED